MSVNVNLRSLGGRRDQAHPRRVRRVTILVAVLGTALVAAALAANQHWLDQHFLPSFFLPRGWYVVIENVVRLTVGAAGVIIVAFRASCARRLVRAGRTVAYAAVAAVLALVAGEFVLRHTQPRPTEWLAAREEPLRVADARLGWVLAPGRTGYATVGGRRIAYVTDSAGDRVARVDEPVDTERPTMVFVGESVMFGEGLAWDDTIPAQVGSMLGVQIANLAVHGYSNDQAYLKLVRDLPRFRHPVAVVSLFMTDLFGRNLDHDRPHLAPGLVWTPAVQRSRLESLARLVVPYRAASTVDRGVRVTHEVLAATVQLARSRGATPLIVVPQFGPEDHVERALRDRVIGETLPYLLVTVDGEWRLPWDRHPNARAAHTIAAAIAERLRHH